MAEDPNRVVSPAEAAKMKGVHINTIYQAINRGALKAYRSNASWLIRMADLNRWEPRRR